MYLCDEQSLLFWKVEYSGAPSTMQVGRYVMGEPWIAIPNGQTVTVTWVGRFAVDPGSGGGSASTPIDASYPGPVIPGGPNPEWRHGTMKNPLSGGIMRQVPDPPQFLTVTEEVRPQPLGYDGRLPLWTDPNPPWPPQPQFPAAYPGFDSTLYLGINTNTTVTSSTPGPNAVLLSPGDVLVSTVSNPNAPTATCPGPFKWQTIYETCGGTCSNGNRCGNSPIRLAAVFSVLVNDANTPADGQAFRKPYSLPMAPQSSAQNRLGLPHLELADIEWQHLPRAEWPNWQTASTLYPSTSHAAALVSRVWLDHRDGQWAEDNVNPTDHMAGYGQYQREMLCTVAAMVCLNPDGYTAGTPLSNAPANPDFNRMVYGLLQAGIDTWGLLQDPNHMFSGGGGKGGGRKFPVVFAGKMFGSQAYAGLTSSLPVDGHGAVDGSAVGGECAAGHSGVRRRSADVRGAEWGARHPESASGLGLAGFAVALG